MKIKVWHLFSVALSVALVLSMFAYWTKGTTPATGPYYLTGPPLTTVRYEVTQFDNGSYYMVNGANWHTEYVSTNASQVINFALGNLTANRTWQEKVLLVGNFSLTQRILVYGETYLQTVGYVTWTSGSAANMIECGNSSTYADDVVIDGGYWDGNLVANNGVYWIHTTGPAFYRRGVIFRNLVFRNLLQDGMYVHPSATSTWEIDNVQTYICYHNGIELEGVADFSIHDCPEFSGDYTQTGNYWGLKMIHCSSGTISNCYIDDGANLEMFDVAMSNCYDDSNGNRVPLLINGAGACTFSNIRIHVSQSAGYQSYAAIKLQDCTRDGSEHSLHNTFVNIVIGRTIGAAGGGTNIFKYGVQETASSDYNSFEEIDAADVVTAGILTVGANSKVVNSWNGTTYIGARIAINRFFGITPTAAGWDTAPTTLANCVDNDWTTVTGTGTTSTGTGFVGNLTWDMGAVYGVELRMKIGLWSASGTEDTKWYWSSDGTNYYPTTNVVTSQIGVTSEYVQFSQIEFVVARYIRVLVEKAGGTTGNANAKFYECQAWDPNIGP